MARADSGNETLFSDENFSPCDNRLHSPSSGLGSANSTVQENTPPKISGSLSKGKVILRPVAFKPVSTRFTNNIERYGSTPILARPGSQMTLYGSSNDIRHSNYSIERKLASASPLAMSSLPFSTGRKHRMGYDSFENVNAASLPSQFMSDRPRSGTLERPRSGTLERPRSGTLDRPGTVFDRSKSSTLDRPNSKSSSFRLVESTNQTGSCADLTRVESTEIVSDLEAALKERDYELAYLRQTMEHNEQVIFRVYQEKEKAWEREIKRLKALHETRLRTGAQKSMKLEQMLIMQTYQLQEDKKRLRSETERSEQETKKLNKEIDVLKSRLEETEWNLCQKSGELALLKSKIKDTQGDQIYKSHEVVQMRTEIRDLKLEIDEKNQEIKVLKREINEIRDQHDLEETELKLIIQQLQHKINQTFLDDSLLPSSKPTSPSSDYHSLDNISSNGNTPNPISNTPTSSNSISKVEYDKLKEEFQELNMRLYRDQTLFEREKVTWAEEKEKVLNYQRQLQLNYVQMLRRSKQLEHQLSTLSLQLGNGHKKPPSLQTSVSHTAIQL